jgi:small subunit ribosomal protein S15
MIAKTALAKPTWVKMKEPELKKTIAELAKTKTSSQIGFILRDQYGIPTTRIFGKKLNAYLKELGIEKNEDLKNAEKKVENLKEHLKTNITDRSAKHKLQKAQSRLHITQKYFGVQKVKKK